MSLLSRLFGLGKVAPTAGRNTARLRRLEAAALHRLNASWKTSAAAIDEELRNDLDKTRERSRDLALNDPYMRRFLRMVARNVVGPNGYTLQARSMNAPAAAGAPATPDTAANAAIEAAWFDWCRPGVCEITGRHSFADVCRNTVSTVARDGEALVRLIFGPATRNRFGFAVQLLDPQRIDTDLNVASAGGRPAIIMGVEIDEYSRPLALWLRPLSGVGPSQRIPAGELLHVFLADHPEQSRGLPWAHSAIAELHAIKEYKTAAVTAARVGASQMGFFSPPDSDPASAGARNLNADDPGADEDWVIEAEAGEFGVLPPGTSLHKFDPDYPHAQFADFLKAGLRSISSGFDVAYNGMANDLEGVSFGSLRGGAIDERDQWQCLQHWFEGAFIERIYAAWFDAALLAGQIKTPAGAALPATKRDKFFPHQWQPRRWQWVDPKKDIEAAREAVRSGISSPQQVAAQQGRDIEDVLDDIAAFEAMARAKGVSIVDYGKPGTAQATPADPEEAED